MPRPTPAWPATLLLPTADPAKLMPLDTTVPHALLAIMASLQWPIAAVGADIRSARPVPLAALHAPPTPHARPVRQG